MKACYLWSSDYDKICETILDFADRNA